MSTYTYNPVSGVLGIGIDEHDEDPEYISLKDYITRLCTSFGFGVGTSGIVSSTGPFSATMRELHGLFCDYTAKVVAEDLQQHETGTEELLHAFCFPVLKLMQERLREIEIAVKVDMFKDFAIKVREAF